MTDCRWVTSPQEFSAEDEVELYILTKPFGSGGSSESFSDTMRIWAHDHLGLTLEAGAKGPTL